MSDGKKKSIFKKWWVWAIALVVVVGVFGSGGGDSSSSGNSNSSTSSNGDSTNKSAATNTTAKAEVKEFYTVGEEVKLKDNVLIVNSVEKSNGSEWDKPKDGNEFVIVHVTIKNGGNAEITYNPFDFSMQNSKGQITDQAFTTINSDTKLNSGQLAAGGEVSGTVVFEQPVGDAALVLKYKSNYFSSKEVKVKMN